MWKRIVATIAGTPLVLVGISLTPIGAAAIDPCEITATRGGVAVSTSDVERTSYSIYCVAKFKTVANDYSFTVPAGITKVDYLVVGGGGGGASGGGGAGGVLMSNDYSVTPGASIAIAVGAGGVGGVGPGHRRDRHAVAHDKVREARDEHAVHHGRAVPGRGLPVDALDGHARTPV